MAKLQLPEVAELDTAAACMRTRLSRSQVVALIYSGDLRARRDGIGRWRIQAADVDAIAAGKIATRPAGRPRASA